MAFPSSIFFFVSTGPFHLRNFLASLHSLKCTVPPRYYAGLLSPSSRDHKARTLPSSDYKNPTNSSLFTQSKIRYVREMHLFSCADQNSLHHCSVDVGLFTLYMSTIGSSNTYAAISRTAQCPPSKAIARSITNTRGCTRRV